MDCVLYLCNMKHLIKVVLACSMLFGFTYTFAYKPNDGKLHCKICDQTHFITSRKITKFSGEGDDRTVKSGVFYKCADCGFLTDIQVK